MERVIGYEFSDKTLLERAMTHSSYSNERKINKTECNERLEFLGDAVLEIISSDLIYKKYPDMPEGKMSKLRASLVCEPALYESSLAIKLGDYIRLGKGEEAGGGRNKPSVVSDAFEALIGAIYLDGGQKKSAEIILKYILSNNQLENAEMQDSKSYLQELVQSAAGDNCITYEVVEERGPEHDKEYVVRVLVNGQELGRGCGKSKKAAEKDAASHGVAAYKNNNMRSV